MKQAVLETIPYTVCLNKDEKEFIYGFLEKSKDNIVIEEVKGKWVIGCRYSADHIRMIDSTSSDILHYYQVRFMNDRVFVTVDKEDSYEPKRIY